MAGSSAGRKRNDNPAEAKKRFLEFYAEGRTINDALQLAGRTRTTYETWRRSDPQFAVDADRIRQMRLGAAHVGGEQLSFSDFSERYLGARVFPHMQNVVDLIEGQDPSWRHPGMTFEPGEQDLLIVNMPPEHPVAYSTPVLTANRGWVTAGEVTEDDLLFGPDGVAAPIREIWDSPAPVPVFQVRFDSGDTVVTSAEHKWNVYPVFAGNRARATVQQMSTAQLAAEAGCYRVPVTDPIDGPDADLPLDPYLFGYWLGDGTAGTAVFAVGFEDTPHFEGVLADLGLDYRVSLDSRGRSNAIYVRGIRSKLTATGMLGDLNRRIPQQYFMGSYKQRLSLLQGLMDADGTITNKDSRARFVQHKHDLALDVYRLVASLGLKPHFKHYGDAYEVGFRTDGESVFRLERKASRQLPRRPTSKASHRVIKSVTPVGEERVRCFTVLTDTNEWLVGNGLIPTRNAKTTSVTINYVTYRICMDPNVRIILVSKTQDMAKKMLYAVKTRLTHPKYAEMIANYAPVGGFDKNAEAWNQNMIYVSGDARDSGEKDPTVQALGIRGHIYGARADLIIMDDCVDLTNAHEYEKQIDWLQSEVISRISSQGALLVVGTRLASKDLYSELRDASRYPDEVSPWTYLSMPAVLEFAEDPKDWFTLWPRSNQPEAGARGEDTEPGEDGLFPKWDGPRLAKKRARVSPRAWALVYQQQQVADEGIFSAEALRASINGNRMTGLMPRGMVNCRADGMDGLICVAGLDPAMAGHTAATVIGLDLATQKRFVLDLWNRPAMTPDQIRDLIREWTAKYGIVEWRVEKNAFQTMLTQDREVREYLAGAGAVLREHFTGANKHDVDFGVASMTTLWAGWQDKRQLIELPSTAISEASKALVEQLMIWHPAAPKTQKTDLVMSLWFAELACRDRIMAMSSYARSHVNNPFATRFDKAGRATVNLNDAERDRMFVTL